MKRLGWRWLVISSICAVAFAAHAETRPQYGGTLHVAMRAAPASLDPADTVGPDSFGRRNLTLLLFDTLVTVESNGRAEGSLALSWESSPDNRRWQFRLHKEIVFTDGTPLTAEIVSASLHAANPDWNASSDGESLIIERKIPDPEMLAELALPRNAIALRKAGGIQIGSGPFRVVDWQLGKKVTLAANESYWHGRPFLDSIEIEMGKGYREQLTALELGKTDLVEIPAEQTHRVSLQGRTISSSSPMELIALAFAHDATSSEEKARREVLALSIDRDPIRSVLLQGTGQPAASILPAWMSGYGFVFRTQADLSRARRERNQVNASPQWSLGYENGDTMAQLIAERIALNAKDAGLRLQPTSNATADIKVIRIPLATTDPRLALDECASAAGLPATQGENGSAEQLYAAEKAALATQRLLPLFHLPVSYSAASNVRNWTVRTDGTWRLDDVWLGPARP